MKPSVAIAFLALAITPIAYTQQPATLPSSPASSGTPAEQQKNAGSATQDTSGTTGDQITKPAGVKASTLIGCLAGPDKEGKFTLRNMAHRGGVQVLGPDDLTNNSGSKVKLTGQWQPLPQAQPPDNKTAATQRFQATAIDVVAPNCKPPSETTPVSKNKPQKPTTYDAPGSDSAK